MPSTSRHYATALACLAILVSTMGCAELKQWANNGYKVGPNYMKPAAAVSADWIDFNNPRVISQSHGVDHGAWWYQLNDPIVNQLVARAYEENLSLRAAGMRVLEAQAQRAIAEGQFGPQFQEAFGSYNHIQLSAAGNQFGLPGIPARTLDLWATGFNASWELDFWGRFRRNLEAAEAETDATIEDYDDVLVCLVAETALAYVEMRGFEERIRYARANVQSQKDSLAIAESRFRNGAVSELDVTIAKSNLADTASIIPPLEAGLRVANNRLCVLLGIPPRNLMPEFGEGEIPEPPPEVVVGVPAELLRRRPDIRAAERRVAAQSARIGVATADLFPAFSIDGSINWQARKPSDLLSSAANGGFITPQFNWAILNYGRIRNNIVAQDARFQELALLYQQAVLTANAEVESAITTYIQAHERVAVLKQGVEASVRSQDLVMKRYREGDVDISALYIAQSLVATQQDQLAAAEAETAVSLIRIYKALGGGWQIRFGQGGFEPASVEELPGDEPGEEQAAGDAAGNNATEQGDGAPANNTPANNAPMNNAPMNNAPMNNAPMNNAPANEPPANAAPGENTPASGAGSGGDAAPKLQPKQESTAFPRPTTRVTRRPTSIPF